MYLRKQLEAERQAIVETLAHLKKSAWTYTAKKRQLEDYLEGFSFSGKISSLTCALSSQISNLEKAIHASDSCMRRDEQTRQQNRQFYKKCNNDPETAYLVVSKRNIPLGYGRFFIVMARPSFESSYSSVALYLDHVQCSWPYEDILKSAIFHAGVALGRKLELTHVYVCAYQRPLHAKEAEFIFFRKKSGISHIKRDLTSSYFLQSFPCLDLYNVIKPIGNNINFRMF